MRSVAVIGAGSWGTAMCGLVAPHADEVRLWALEDDIVASVNAEHRNARYLVDYTLPANVRATGDLGEAVAGVDAAIMASPSAYLRPTCANVAATGQLGAGVPVLVLSKGIELGTHLLMHQVAGQELGVPSRVAALSGPNHAEEICKGVVSAAVVAAEEPDVARFFQGLVVSPAFRAYLSDDIVGVETCGAVKNVVAIACGIAAGLGCGDNTLAVLMTRGVAEMGRVVSSLGGNPLTCMGLAGMGDLVVTCTSEHSRNRTFGEALVRGETLEHYQARRRMVVEGAQAARSVRELAKERGIEAPITEAVYQVLYGGLGIEEGVGRLLGRDPARDEFYGIDDEEARHGEGR